MNFPPSIALCFLFLIGSWSSLAADPAGRWIPPDATGRPWKHQGTNLSFPSYLGDYRFAGHFEYADEGVLLRYENLQEQARMDIFLFKSDTLLTTLEDKHRRLLQEMDVVARDMESMVKQGRYKNLNLGEVVGTEVELWQQQSLPMATRVITATRVGISKDGSAEAVVRQFVGSTVLNGFLMTMRHMRPTRTGEEGEEAMRRILGLVLQIIKDPSIRAHIRQMVVDYLDNPFSPDGEQAAAAVLAYLKNTPYFPVSVPEEPFADWLLHCKAVSPGTEDHLLRAFMLGSAKAAFDDGEVLTCLNEGARQFAKVYRVLVGQHPQITRPEMELFVDRAAKGEGAAWLKERDYLK